MTMLVDIVGLPGSAPVAGRSRSVASHREPVALGWPTRTVRARYDAAQTNHENSNHWANADDLSASAALDPATRTILRKRSRYEVANNTYAKGMLRTLADYVVGTGPRLQVLTSNRGFNRAVEQAFADWARRTQFARKLWLMRFAQAQDGEAFAQWFTNRGLGGQVRLDLNLIESDRVTDPALSTSHSDGIVYDDYGNPIAYRILKRHPGETGSYAPLDFDTVRAGWIAHLYRCERPGQLRGVPEITPALPLFALLRRFTLATVAAAETAASLAGVIKTQNSPEDPDDLVAMDEVEIPYRYLMTLPGGYEIQQLKAEHPAQTYEGFKRALLCEIARCLSMPFNIAAADSSTYNFASGKLDHSTFFKAVGIDQAHLEDAVAAPTLALWYREARTYPDYLPDAPEGMDPAAIPHTWNWDGQELLDPREASAKAEGLRCGFETYPAIFGKRGLDFEQEHEAQAAALGMSLADYRAALRQTLFPAPPTTPAPSPEPADSEVPSEDDGEDTEDADVLHSPLHLRRRPPGTAGRAEPGGRGRDRGRGQGR